MKFSYQHGLVNSSQLNAYLKKLKPEIHRMHEAAQKEYADDRASINLPIDKQLAKTIAKMTKKHKKTDTIFVIGIGGSNLGTIAVTEAVLGKYHNETHKKKIYFADTVDTDALAFFSSVVKKETKHSRNVLLCFITKSGGTTETIANFELLYSVLRKNVKNAHHHVVAITDEGSKLWHVAEHEHFERLAIPKLVGGRYSVFSAVGLFPLAVLGVDIKKLLKGAATMRKQCLGSGMKNTAAVSATLHYHHFKKKRTIADTFLFAGDLESIGKWYRQLMGESIGKEFNRQHKRVFNGMTPTVSIGSTDLHSMAQLYLGGPYDKFTTFVTVKKWNASLSVPKMKQYNALVPHIQGMKFSAIMDAIVQGVQIAFAKGKRPFCEVKLKEKSAYEIGQLLQFKMMEMMYLGFLMNVNPFDQPNVEAYKIETKKILSR